MRGEYEDVLARLQERERSVCAARQGQRNARLERMAALRHSAARLAARHARLRWRAGALGSPAPALARALDAAPPAAPASDGDAAWSEHVRNLEAAVRALETALAEAGGTHGERLREALAASVAAPTLDEVLSAYVLQRQLQPGLPVADAQRFRETAQRVLARLDLPEGAPLPAELEALARAVVLAPTRERAEALASELRLAVQRQREDREAQQHDTAAAKALLDELPEDAPAALVHALEAVAAGVTRLDRELRDAALALLERAAADRALAADGAAALVLQESLRDLGYEVEDIESTLFVDGGAVHFRRAGWDRYFVRLRVDRNERTVNFNVVRARGAEENAERRRQDALAEDRWCAEFPRLMQTLASRGLTLDVTRRLEAGEIPVQVVDPARLPVIAALDDATRPRAAPKAREQP